MISEELQRRLESTKFFTSSTIRSPHSYGKLGTPVSFFSLKLQFQEEQARSAYFGDPNPLRKEC